MVRAEQFRDELLCNTTMNDDFARSRVLAFYAWSTGAATSCLCPVRKKRETTAQMQAVA